MPPGFARAARVELAAGLRVTRDAVLWHSAKLPLLLLLPLALSDFDAAHALYLLVFLGAASLDSRRLRRVWPAVALLVSSGTVLQAALSSVLSASLSANLGQSGAVPQAAFLAAGASRDTALKEAWREAGLGGHR